jgi:hypothetical protein
MDDFIHSLSYKAPDRVYPAPNMLMNLWSLHTGHWFGAADTPVIHVITSEGDEVSIDPANYTNSVWHRLLGVDQADTETDDNDELPDSDDASDAAADADAESEVDAGTIIDRVDSDDAVSA